MNRSMSPHQNVPINIVRSMTPTNSVTNFFPDQGPQTTGKELKNFSYHHSPQHSQVIYHSVQPVVEKKIYVEDTSKVESQKRETAYWINKCKDKDLDWQSHLDSHIAYWKNKLDKSLSVKQKEYADSVDYWKKKFDQVTLENNDKKTENYKLQYEILVLQDQVQHMENQMNQVHNTKNQEIDEHVKHKSHQSNQIQSQHNQIEELKKLIEQQQEQIAELQNLNGQQLDMIRNQEQQIENLQMTDKKHLEEKEQMRSSHYQNLLYHQNQKEQLTQNLVEREEELQTLNSQIRSSEIYKTISELQARQISQLEKDNTCLKKSQVSVAPYYRSALTSGPISDSRTTIGRQNSQPADVFISSPQILSSQHPLSVSQYRQDVVQSPMNSSQCSQMSPNTAAGCSKFAYGQEDELKV